MRSLTPRDLLPAAETRKPDAKSVLAQTPPAALSRVAALPEARLRTFPRTLRRTAAARGREPVEDPRAEEPGESTLLPSLPHSPPRSLPPLPKNVPLRGEQLRPEMTPPSHSSPFSLLIPSASVPRSWGGGDRRCDPRDPEERVRPGVVGLSESCELASGGGTVLLVVAGGSWPLF